MSKLRLFQTLFDVRAERQEQGRVDQEYNLKSRAAVHATFLYPFQLIVQARRFPEYFDGRQSQAKQVCQPQAASCDG